SIRTGRRRDAVANILRAVEFAAFAWPDRVRLAAGGNLAGAADRGNASGFAVFGNVNAKCTGLANSEREIWRVDFVDFAFAQLADSEIDRALGDAHLDGVVVEIQE